jgi:hypothetical protein
MMDSSCYKQNVIPPYQVNTMLLKSPSFNTTHLSEYVLFNKYKYANIKSKYKDIKNYKTKSTTTG